MNVRSIIPAGRKLKILRKETESIRPSTPRPARRDCHGRLIAKLVELGGPDAAMTDSVLLPWCSPTFVGARHMLTLEMATEGAAALAERLPNATFAIPGHIVADLCVDTIRTDGGRTCLDMSVLTIEAW